MSKKYLLLFVILAGTLINGSSTQYRSKIVYVRVTKGALESVPTSLRERLVKRLDSYLKYLSEKRFDKVYELMPDDCKHGLDKDEWMSQVRLAVPGQPQEFVIDTAYVHDYDAPKIWSGERWIIRGCEKYRKGQEVVNYQAYIGVLLFNGDWYVCSSGIAVEGPDNEYVPCSDEG